MRRVLTNLKNVLIICYRVDFNKSIFGEMLTLIKENYIDYKMRYTIGEITGAKSEEIGNNEVAKNFFENNRKQKEIISVANLNRDKFIKLGLSLSCI